MSAGGLRGVVEAARRWRAEGVAFALIVVAETEGSTYRKAGAVSAVARDGRREGVISGGCLEPSVDELARAAVDAGEPRAITLDTRRDDDAVFGSGSGCRGRMRVLAIPVLPQRECAALDAIVRAWSAGAAARLRLGELAPAIFSEGAVEIPPPVHVLLLGAGPEAPPLLRLARALGWRTLVGDHRPALLQGTRLAEADRVIEGRPRDVLASCATDAFHAALVMTHVASADIEALSALAAGDVPRIGLLGPPQRRDELLAQLSASERASLSSRLSAPAGLRLGGDGPEAIALSVVAGLQRSLHSES